MLGPVRHKIPPPFKAATGVARARVSAGTPNAPSTTSCRAKTGASRLLFVGFAIVAALEIGGSFQNAGALAVPTVENIGQLLDARSPGARLRGALSSKTRKLANAIAAILPVSPRTNRHRAIRLILPRAVKSDKLPFADDVIDFPGLIAPLSGLNPETGPSTGGGGASGGGPSDTPTGSPSPAAVAVPPETPGQPPLPEPALGTIPTPVVSPAPDGDLPPQVFLPPNGSPPPVVESRPIGNLLPVVPPAVPEPSSWLMMILGLGLVGAILRRKDQRIGSRGLQQM